MSIDPTPQDPKTQKQRLMKKGLILVIIYFILAILFTLWMYYEIEKSGGGGLNPFGGFSILNIIQSIFLFIILTLTTVIIILIKYLKIDLTINQTRQQDQKIKKQVSFNKGFIFILKLLLFFIFFFIFLFFLSFLSFLLEYFI